MSRVVLLMSAALFVVSCGSAQVDRRVVGAAHQVKLPLDTYLGVSWLSQGEIVIDRQPPPKGDARRAIVPWRFAPDGSGFAKLRLPETKDGCFWIEFRAPHRLLDGSLALHMKCTIPENAVTYYTWLVKVTDHGRSTEIIAPGRNTPPVIWKNFGPAPDNVIYEFAFSRDLSLGIGGATSNCGSLVRLTPDGVAPLDLTIRGSGKSWNLKEQAIADPNGECTKFGTASHPSSDPTFSKVAFWAEPDAAGRKVFERNDVVAQMMTIDPKSLELTTLFGGVTSIGPLKWSPTGRWIAFVGDPDERGFGIWLYEVATKRFVLVRKDAPTPSLDWSPDGKAIVAVTEGEGENAIDERTVWTFPILQP